MLLSFILDMYAAPTRMVKRAKKRGNQVQEYKERWKALCEQAAAEQDPEKLRKLVKQIIDLLGQKQKRMDLRPPKE